MKNIESKTLEESLSDLLQSDQDYFFIEEILRILSGNGRLIALLFLSLPFCQPLQIPGMSTPFGIAIIFIGIRMAFGKNFWLPQCILIKKIPSLKVRGLVFNGLKLIKKMGKWIHPHCEWMCIYPFMPLFHGLIIAFLGLILEHFPLPIPLSNLVAAWAIFLIALGTLKKAGILILIGYSISLVILIFFVVLGFSIGNKGTFFYETLNETK